MIRPTIHARHPAYSAATRVGLSGWVVQSPWVSRTVSAVLGSTVPGAMRSMVMQDSTGQTLMQRLQATLHGFLPKKGE